MTTESTGRQASRSRPTKNRKKVSNPVAGRLEHHKRRHQLLIAATYDSAYSTTYNSLKGYHLHESLEGMLDSRGGPRSQPPDPPRSDRQQQRENHVDGATD